MSMHKIPLTEIEEAGLRAHGLKIGTPSQLSDVFRQGMAWQATQSAAVPVVGDYSVTQLQRLKSLMSELGLSTDESLEGFCLDADRQLSRAITAMEKTIKALMSFPVVGEVVAIRCGDDAEGWTIFSSDVAENYAQYTDCNSQKLVVQPTTSITAAELNALRKDAERLDAAMKIMFDDWHPLSVAFGKMQTASTKDELFEQLDAAIAGEKDNG